MSEPLIKLDHITAGYNGTTVLDDISLEIHENEFLGIIGPNGGGKTTLLKIILGLMEPRKGAVSIFGKEPKAGRTEIGYVPQYTDFHRDFPLKVWDVVLMGRLGRSLPFRWYNREDKKFAEAALDLVSITDLKNKQIGELSEGQKQRVFIARALATQAKVLLLDEPTASVDHPMQTSLYELLKDLANHMTVVLISHDLGVIPSYVSKVACLNKKLFYHGSGDIDMHAVEEAYQCPIDLIGHGHAPHRVLKEHE